MDKKYLLIIMFGALVLQGCEEMVTNSSQATQEVIWEFEEDFNQIETRLGLVDGEKGYIWARQDSVWNNSLVVLDLASGEIQNIFNNDEYLSHRGIMYKHDEKILVYNGNEYTIVDLLNGEYHRSTFPLNMNMTGEYIAEENRCFIPLGNSFPGMVPRACMIDLDQFQTDLCLDFEVQHNTNTKILQMSKEVDDYYFLKETNPPFNSEEYKDYSFQKMTCDGELLWSYSIIDTLEVVEHTVYPSVITGEDVIFTKRGKLYSLDKFSGELNWKLEFERGLWPKLIIHDGFLYFKGDKTYKIEIESGNVVWESPAAINFFTSKYLVSDTSFVDLETGETVTIDFDRFPSYIYGYSEVLNVYLARDQNGVFTFSL